MADAKELRDYALVLRSNKPSSYDDWRNMCLTAADMLVRQASYNESLLNERAEIIQSIDKIKQANLVEKQAYEAEIQKLRSEVSEVHHWLSIERRKNKKQG